jgi:hypothetical protein
MPDRSLCSLQLAVGEREPCPGDSCAFWEAEAPDGGGRCPFESVRLELEARPAVSRWLLGLRRELEQSRSAEEQLRVRSALNALLPPGLRA